MATAEQAALINEVVRQDLTRIDDEIVSGELAANPSTRVA